MAEEYTLKQLIQAAVNRESSKANTEVGASAIPVFTFSSVVIIAVICVYYNAGNIICLLFLGKSNMVAETINID